jgi:hypothetical protein
MVNMVDVFCVVYENRIMKLVEIVLRRGDGKRENDGGVNLTKIHSVHIYKCHNISPCTAIIC